MKGCELMAYTSPLQLITESVSGFNNVTTMVDTFTKNESAYEAALKARKSYNDDCRAIKRNYYKAVLESKDNPYVIQQAFNESEGNIIVRFFKFIFDAIKNAFKAIGNFFKDLFSKDSPASKSSIDKDKKNVADNIKAANVVGKNATVTFIDIPPEYSSVTSDINQLDSLISDFNSFMNSIDIICKNTFKGNRSDTKINFNQIAPAYINNTFRELYSNNEIDKVDSYESLNTIMNDKNKSLNDVIASAKNKEQKLANPVLSAKVDMFKSHASSVSFSAITNLSSAGFSDRSLNPTKVSMPYDTINEEISRRRENISKELAKLNSQYNSMEKKISNLDERSIKSIEGVSDAKFIKVVKHIAADFKKTISVIFGMQKYKCVMYKRFVLMYNTLHKELEKYTKQLSSDSKPDKEFEFNMLDFFSTSGIGGKDGGADLKKNADVLNKHSYSDMENIERSSFADAAIMYHMNEAFIHGMQVDGSTIFDNLDPRDFNRTDWMDLTLECNYMLDEEMAQVRQDTFVKECLLLTTPGAHISDLINLQEANTNRLATTLQKAGNRIKQIFQKFLEKLRSIGSDRKRYLEKYKNTILNQKPKFRKIEINDYKKAFDNWRKPIIPQPNFTDMKQTCNGTTGDGMQIAIFKKYFANTINVGRAFSDNDSIAEYCKEFFQCGDNAKKIEMNVQTDMNMTDIYNFLYDQKKITDQINNEIKNFQKLMTDISNVAKREQPKQEAARISGVLNDDVVWSSVYESYITEFEVKDEGNNQNQNNGNQNNDSQRLSDNIQNVEKSNVNDNPQDNPDNQNYDEEIATNFSKVVNTVIGAKLTSIEFFGKELFDVVRMHVKDFINNETFVRQQQQGTNYNNNQNQ